MGNGKSMSLTYKTFPVPNRWSLHGYYTLCPYAPDGSGRILAAGADLQNGTGEVLILSPEGKVLDRFGSHPLDGSFYHTGWWQTWSPDSRYVYYQAGSLKEPKIGKRDLATGTDSFIDGDMEGAPPTGEPILSGLLGMLYAAGYGDGIYKPAAAPVPFQERSQHGIFEHQFSPEQHRLRISVDQLVQYSPDRKRILASDHEIQSRLGPEDGLTLMAYCLRWSPDGSRLLFFFGNHCVVKERGEPKITYVFTTDREMKQLHVAVNLSYGRRGVHWSWQPDNEHLIGYGPRPDDPSKTCLAEVRYDGTGYRMLSEHASGGHPSVSPTNPDLIVTDGGIPGGGAVVLISRKTGKEIERVPLPKFIGEREAPGRNPFRVCHHPVFNRTGDRILCNTLPGNNAVLAEIHL